MRRNLEANRTTAGPDLCNPPELKRKEKRPYCWRITRWKRLRDFFLWDAEKVTAKNEHETRPSCFDGG